MSAPLAISFAIVVNERPMIGAKCYTIGDDPFGHVAEIDSNHVTIQRNDGRITVHPWRVLTPCHECRVFMRQDRGGK